MHSFILSETLKYLYLLFSADSVISLDDFVFNAAGHPLKVQDSLVSEHSHQRLFDNREQKIQSVVASNAVLRGEVNKDPIISVTEIDSNKHALVTGKLLVNGTDYSNLNKFATNKNDSLERTLTKSSAETWNNVGITGELVVAHNEMSNNETEVFILSEKGKLKAMLETPIPPMMPEGDLLKEMVKRGTSKSAQSILDVKI